ncbi:beta-2-microglobulin-like [Xyrichtys novacula]|uniref:Beta-2-microglobulin-like n=1 Tax=Xyrichtys novacula TaxID=13765 RepID=A0AAV1F3S3_XYRNO|nr:beta-2-microglobulin-like [Xyrichtys novacula]
MKTLIFAVFLCVLCHTVRSLSDGAPQVNIYSRNLGALGQKNVLICHVSRISPPPKITIDLMKDGKVIEGATQTDLAFDGDWNYYLTKHADFVPQKGERFACRVTYNGKTTKYEWGAGGDLKNVPDVSL